MMPILLVGRRGDGGHRDRLWNYCEAFWTRELGWPISVGIYDDLGPFCLAAASNRAKAGADALLPEWTVALYVGADVVLGSADQAHVAVDLAEKTGQLVFAHDHYYSLSKKGTERVLAGAEPHGSMNEWPDHGPWPNTFSSALAITRDLWEKVGGFDERHIGWGFDDLSFMTACGTLGGGLGRTTGPVFHLAHPRHREEREGSPTHGANQVLWERYRDTRWDKRAMLALLAEPGGPLCPK